MGSIFHFDGALWSKIDIDDRLSTRDFASLNGTTYAVAYRLDEQPADTIWWYFLAWNNTQWDELDTYLDVAGQNLPRTFGSALSVIAGELYSGGGAVFKMKSGRWERIFSGPNAGRVAGPSENNLFSVGFAGTVYHYNGSDWFQFTQFESSEFRFAGVWFDGKEVFVVGNNSSKTLVLHGK